MKTIELDKLQSELNKLQSEFDQGFESTMNSLADENISVSEKKQILIKQLAENIRLNQEMSDVWYKIELIEKEEEKMETLLDRLYRFRKTRIGELFSERAFKILEYAFKYDEEIDFNYNSLKIEGDLQSYDECFDYLKETKIWDFESACLHNKLIDLSDIAAYYLEDEINRMSSLLNYDVSALN